MAATSCSLAEGKSLIKFNYVQADSNEGDVVQRGCRPSAGPWRRFASVVACSTVADRSRISHMSGCASNMLRIVQHMDWICEALFGSRTQPYNTLLPRRRNWTVLRLRLAKDRSAWLSQAPAPEVWKDGQQWFHSRPAQRSGSDTKGQGIACWWPTGPASSQKKAVALPPMKLGAPTCPW